ncbi:MAG TPA: MMPL family transporter [Solirubrobacteraceae bacterium]|nr:MMPL family transporter [Solirubrobacteraceae bacterium]
MQRAMDRLSGLVRRRRKLVLATWLLLLLASLPFAARQTENLTGGGFDVPNTGSTAVEEQIDRFEGASSESLGIVLEDRGGDLAAAVDRADAAAAAVDHVELSDAAVADAKQSAGPVVLLPLEVDASRDEALDTAKELRDELHVGDATGGVQPYLVGQSGLWAGMQELQQEDLEKAERAGFPAILIVLLVVFGSMLAALLPVGLGVAAVVVTGAAVYFLALATTMSVFVTNVASMLGIGVAVDYSLFLLSRYREELHRGGDRAHALDVAMRTSGATVAFSGVTVLVSLAGLFLLNSTVMRSLAIGAMVVVAIAVLGAITLLPALIALLGRRADEPGRVVSASGALARRLARRPEAAGDSRFWARWTARVMRRPARSAAVAAALLLLLAVPALSLEYGNGALRMFPADHETRRGAELAGEVVGPGTSSPVLIVAHSRDQAAIDRYVAQLSATRGVAEVLDPQPSDDGRAALIRVVLDSDPESREALALVDRLEEESPLRVDIGGSTAQAQDFNRLISGGIWKVFLFVMVCSYLVLLVVLRSVLLPLKAVLMNLLSVAAAYGVLVAIFQYGWLDGITGYDSLGYINTVTPPLLLAIVFGLSMDYEVFLLSRIRERYLATGDNRRAVAEGLEASAKVITSAALIMVVVFGTFALTGVPQIKEIGVGLAVAIALDATLVRLVLVPAAMELMGDWNWWLPRRLDRVLPRADFESDVAEDRAPALS